VNGGSAIGLVGFSADGSKLLAIDQLMAHTGGSLHWFDVAAERVTLSKIDIHDGSVRSVAISDDGALVATAASDGLVRIWDAGTLELMHELPLGDTPIQGVAFVDDQHLAVTPQDGGLLFVTLDTDELLTLVRGSLTRGFTQTECARFGFGDECPTLAELRPRPDGTGDPAALNGRFTVAWTAEQFARALAAAGEPTVAGRGTSGGYAGTYTVSFDDGRFDIVQDGAVDYCVGSYVVTDERVLLIAERGESIANLGCPPGPFLEATFELGDDALALTAITAHPVDAVLLASRELARLAD
jgi:hypothetical protein